MLKILILICPVAVDHAACDQTNAIDVIRSMSVASSQQCGLVAQTTLAQTPLSDPAKQYAKILCIRDHGAVAAKS